MEIPILFLEDYASGQTVCILKWGYSVAQSFSEETNWHEGTIAFTDDWSSIHGLLCVINGVGFFTNSHHNSGIAINDGDYIVGKVYSCAEGFSEHTNRNHSSPVAVYIRSSVARDDVVVNNVIGRTNGHCNELVSVDIFDANSVGKGISIDLLVYSTVIFYNRYNNIKSGFFVSKNGNTTIFTISYGRILNSYINISVFIGAVSYISFNSTIYFDNITICIYNRNIYSIVFISWSIFTIKSKASYDIFISDGYFYLVTCTIFIADSSQSNYGTDSLLFICRIYSIEADCRFTISRSS